MRNLIVTVAVILCIVGALVSEAEQPVSLKPSTPLIGQENLHSDNQDSDTQHTSGEESLISQVCKGCRIAAIHSSWQFGLIERA